MGWFVIGFVQASMIIMKLCGFFLVPDWITALLPLIIVVTGLSMLTLIACAFVVPLFFISQLFETFNL